MIAQLQGFELAAAGWEREVLPARVAGYDPAWLDELCLSGEVAWGRLAATRARGTRDAAAARRPSRSCAAGTSAGCSSRRDGSATTTALSGPARDVLAHLRDARRLASSTRSPRGARRLRTEVEDALCELVSAGRVTGDGFAGLRAPPALGHAPAPALAGRARPLRAPVGTGRWALLDRASPPAAGRRCLEALARQYIRRYGVVFRDLLAREPGAPAWRDLLRVYRRLEMRGELRGGRFVGGFVGEQFAAPEALDALRAIRRDAAGRRDRPALGLRSAQPRRHHHARARACRRCSASGCRTATACPRRKTAAPALPKRPGRRERITG